MTVRPTSADARVTDDGSWHGVDEHRLGVRLDMDSDRHVVDKPAKRPCRVHVVYEGVDSRHPNPRFHHDVFCVWCDCDVEANVLEHEARRFVAEHEGLLDDDGRVDEARRRRLEQVAAYMAVVEPAVAAAKAARRERTP